MEPAFMGSDSKVSSGTAEEDVGVPEEDAMVQSVFEHEDGRLVMEALKDAERGIDEPEMGVLAESAEVDLDPGSWLLAGRVVWGADAEGAALFAGGGGAGELTGGATCELAGGGGA